MPVNIVEADIKRDLDIFLELLNRNRRNDVGRNRFEWLYLNNPHGYAKAWIVYDENTQEPVAFTSVLPRLVKVDDYEISCWNCCDFSVDQKYRTLGVAVKLRRKAKECVDNGDISSLYAHPNDRMKVIHERVGHTPIGEMNRYARVLRSDHHVHQRVKNRVIANIVSASVNFILKIPDAFFSVDNHYVVQMVGDKKFDDEYDKLFEDIAGCYKIIGDRRSAYLNWRYIENPLYKCDRMIIRDNHKLVGYIIYYIEGSTAVFKDILCVQDENILKTLLFSWIKYLRKKSVHTISAIFMNTNPMVAVFQKAGFKIRSEKSSVYAYARKKDEVEPLWLNGENWYMTVGDRDV